MDILDVNRSDNMKINIEIERLILRELEKNDREKMNYICNQPHILKWMPDWESTIEQIDDSIAFFQKCYIVNDINKKPILLGITSKESDELIGTIALGPKEEVNNEVEVCYYLSKEHCNKGYITEATKVMVQWGLERYNKEFIMAIVELDNISSQKVIEKSGFTKVDTRDVDHEGEMKPFFYYRIYSRGNK